MHTHSIDWYTITNEIISDFWNNKLVLMIRLSTEHYFCTFLCAIRDCTFCPWNGTAKPWNQLCLARTRWRRTKMVAMTRSPTKANEIGYEMNSRNTRYIKEEKKTKKERWNEKMTSLVRIHNAGWYFEHWWTKSTVTNFTIRNIEIQAYACIMMCKLRDWTNYELYK